MAAGFIRKLLGRRPSLPVAVDEALPELDKVVQRRPSLAELTSELRAVMQVLFADPIVESAPNMTTEQAAAKLSAGIPLWRDEVLEVDLPSFRRRWLRLCTVLERRRPDAEDLASAMRQGRLDPTWHLKETLAGRVQSCHAQAESLHLDAALTASVWWLAWFPLLTTLAPVSTLHHALTGWQVGYCPCCGGWPRLGELRGLEQTRIFRCSLCSTEWEFPRLRCPYCQTTDHRRIGYLHVEGEEGQYRASTCDDCRLYVKSQTTLTRLTPPQLLVADLATLHLDLIAAERGYTSPL